MVVTCDIEFENNAEAVYYAGQVVMGKVTLTADTIKQVKAVNLKVHGAAKTRYKSKKRWRWVQVDYINSVTCLFAPKLKDQAAVIEPGIHTISFACHIPVNCPSSFEGYRGFIRYVVQVSLELPWKFDETFTKGFTVLTVANLNYDSPVLKLPVKRNIDRSFCCGPFRSDSLQINVQLPQTGYVPGQLIPITILVTNNTTSRLNEIRARLVMVVEYFSPEPRTSQTETISTLIGDPVLRNCTKTFNYLLSVPATPPTCMTLCSIIQIAYRVEVEAKVQGVLYCNECIHIPVTIGNVPLQMEDVVVQEQPASLQINLENIRRSAVAMDNIYDPCMSSENRDPWSAINNIPAPVFTQAAHMPAEKLVEDVAHEYGEKDYTPKYPVFDVPYPSSLVPINGDELDGQVAPPRATDPDKTTWL